MTRSNKRFPFCLGSKFQNQKMTQLRLTSRSLSLLVLALLTLATWSCKPKSIFMEKARLALVENDVELRSVQIYNDKDIIMRTGKGTSEISQTGGKLIMVDGEQVMEIVIRAGTPGVITGMQNGKFLVRFEAGDGKILQFFKNTKGAFQIDAEKWIGLQGQVRYANIDFLLETQSKDVLLLYKEKKRFSSQAALRTVKGLRVQSSPK
jgi:hypothetical protein